jgi:nitrite reductase (NADH) small subunit
VTLLNDVQVWTTACAYDHLIPGRGVGVLLDDGSQAALFRLDDGSCLDDPRVSVPVYAARVTPEGHIQVARTAA